MNIQINAKGKQCPLPVIEAKNAISGHGRGRNRGSDRGQ